MRFFIVAAGLATSVVLAQGSTQSGAPGAAQKPPNRVCVDAVVATVGGNPILLTELRTVVTPRVRTLESTANRPVSPPEYRHLFNEELEKLLGKHRMAQAAKTFGDQPPEAFDQIVDREVALEKKAQEKEFGSAGFSSELLRQGRPYSSYEQELRLEKMSMVAEHFAVGQRFMRQANLLVTPRMMRETFAQAQGRFVHPAEALVAQVRFTGPDAQKNAEDAAARWRSEDVSARQIASRYPGMASATIDARASVLAPELAKVAEFAFAGPQGNVSAPIAVGDTFHVAKVTRFMAARNGRFEDPEVQAELRAICEQKVLREFRDDANERATRRTQVWKSATPTYQ